MGYRIDIVAISMGVSCERLRILSLEGFKRLALCKAEAVSRALFAHFQRDCLVTALGSGKWSLTCRGGVHGLEGGVWVEGLCLSCLLLLKSTTAPVVPKTVVAASGYMLVMHISRQFYSQSCI